MFNFMKRLNPSDPESAYKMAAFCALVGSVGSFAGVLVRQFVNYYIYKGDSEQCYGRIKELEPYCLNIIFLRRRRAMSWNRFSHLLVLLFNLIMVLPFFVMEDIFSDYEGAGTAKSMLSLAIVLEIIKSAYHNSLRSASGWTGFFYKPIETMNPLPGIELAYGMLDSGFTWITFLRDAIFSIGIYMMCHFDKESEKIGGAWRVCGYIASAAGIITCVCEFLKVFEYGYFNDLSDWTYNFFWMFYLIWIFLFGTHCKSLYRPANEEEASSGSEISDDDDLSAPAPVAEVTTSAATESVPEDAPAEGEGEKKKKKKKKKHHHTEETAVAEAKEAVSDDDV